MLRLSISLLLPEQWWVPSSAPVKVLKATTPTELAALWWAEEAQLQCFILFLSPVPLSEEMATALHQVKPHWKHRVAQRLADATFLELKLSHR